LRGFEFRSIGPATMMGRIDDIAGAEKDPLLIYVGFATGGLWKSIDGGNHWKSQFDNMANESVGAIAIAPSDPNVVYVGTGESNNRQSSSIGDGVWGTSDGGKTWNHLGLEDTHAIGRIVVDPTDPNIVYVAAMGHLFGPNAERGLFKSVDGGKSWKKSKYIDADTGFTDVAIDPSNPKMLYTSSLQRRRTWWGYNGGGPGSGLWKTLDGGETWNRIEAPGWPRSKDGIYGRIALSVFRAKPSTIYAQVETGASGGTGAGTAADGGPARGGRGGFGTPTESAGETPAGTAAAPGAAGGGGGADAGGGGGGRGGRGGPPAPPDPNGSGVYRSDDGGMTWTLMSNQNQRPMYFSQIRVDPINDKKVFVGGNPAQMSLDGGKTWTGVNGSHTDYHAFWINPKDPRTVMVGHDGGLDISNDGGLTWDYHNDIAVGQFYQVSADMRRPYYVCGGLQDNNAWCGPSALRSTAGAVNTDWFTVGGGDGFYTRQDPTDWAIVYAESQDGNMSRHDMRNGTQKSIRPNVGGGRGAAGAAVGTAATPAASPASQAAPPAATPPAGVAPAEAGQTPATAAATGRGGAAGGGGGGGGRGGPPNVVNPPPNVETLRFYWNAPFEISPHNPAVVYMAGQYFFKSNNRGDTWWMNPTDLSRNINRWAPELAIMGVSGEKPMASKHDGYAASSVATQVRESPSKPGVIWVGTEDGNLQLSQDGGETFTNVAGNIAGAPKGYTHISRIEPSHFDPGTAYVAIDNHRNDDWKPYLFKTTDYGKKWVSVAANLPAKGNINALREDYDNPNLLFAGTEFGLYVTLDAGKEWKKFMTGLPSVRVDDILIHPRERDLIIGTHGRSIYIADDITPLEQLKLSANKDLTLFDPRPATLWKNDPQAQRRATNRQFQAKNPQGGTAIHVLAKSDMGAGKLEFLLNNQVASTMDVQIKAGMNRFQWPMRGPVTAGGGRGAAANAAAGAVAPAAASTDAPPGAATADAAGGRGGRRGGRGGAPVASVGQPASGQAGGAEVPPGAATGTAGVAGGGRGGRGGATGVPFVASGRGGFGGGGGGGGGGFGGFGGGAGALVEPGAYMVRLTVGGQALTSSVTVLEDIWMRPQ
jgi:hypothetical protein